MTDAIIVTGNFTNDQTSGNTSSDQTADDDVLISVDDSNPLSVDYISASLSGTFLGFLENITNDWMTFGLATQPDYDFADDAEAAESTSGFVTVSADEGSNYSPLRFSNASGDPLTGEQATWDHDGDGGADTANQPLKTVDGDNIYYWSYGDNIVYATTGDGTTDTNGDTFVDKGDLVAVFYLNNESDPLSASVETVTFIGLDHPTDTNPDDTVNWGDVLNVTSVGDLEFRVADLESGQFLHATIVADDGQTGLVITGRNPVVKDNDRINSTLSDKVNTSQAGGTTVGIDSQHFDPGNIGVFSLVRNADTSGPLAEGGSVFITDLDFDEHLDVTDAEIFISQIQAGGSNPDVTMNIYAFSAGTTDGVESGRNYIDNELGDGDDNGEDPHADDALADDISVEILRVEIYNGDPDTTSPDYIKDFDDPSNNTGSGYTITQHTTTEGWKYVTVDGVTAGDTIKIITDDPDSLLEETFNRFWVEAVDGTFDIGKVSISEGIPLTESVGDKILVDDDGPMIELELAGNPISIDFDESVGAPGAPERVGGVDPDDDDVAPLGQVSTSTGDISGLFQDKASATDPGTDGLKTRTDTYDLSLTAADGSDVAATNTYTAANGVATTMSVSAPTTDTAGTGDATIHLFLIDGASDPTIEGRVDLDGDGTYDTVALRFTLDDADTDDPTLISDQLMAVFHPNGGAEPDPADGSVHDNNTVLGIAGADPDPDAGMGIVKSSTLVDKDDDEASDSITYNFTDDVNIDDDGPLIDITRNTSNDLDIDLDESIGAPGAPEALGGIDPDSDVATAPVIGQTATAASTGTDPNDIAALFMDVGTPDAGSDGQKSRTDSYTLTLRAEDGTVVAATDTFTQANGVESTMSVSAPTTGGGGAGDQTIYLFLVDGAANPTIEGRADLDGDGSYTDVALSFVLTGGGTDEPILTTQQLMAVAHDTGGDDPGDGSVHDETEILGIAGSPVASAGLNITKTSELKDNDNDTDSDSEDYNFTGDVVLEDDGPVLDIDTVAESSLTIELDESIVLPDSTDDESGSIAAGGDDVTGETEPDGTNAFGETETATGAVKALFTDVSEDAGTDGEKSRTDAYTLSLTTNGGTLVTDLTTGVATNLSVSATPEVGGDATVTLYRVSDTVIEGRVDLDGDGTDDDVAIRFSLTGTLSDSGDGPVLETEQILALYHSDDTDHDDDVTMSIVGTTAETEDIAGVAVVKTSTLTDNDDDTVSDTASYNFTSDVVIEDDGPIVEVTSDVDDGELAALARNLDETYNAAGGDNYNGAEIESGGGAPNGNADDVNTGTSVWKLNPTGTDAIGRLTTGLVAGLFVDDQADFDAFVDYGTDGAGSRTDTLKLVLGSGDALNDPIETNLTATGTGDIAGLSDDERKIWLVINGDGTVIDGVIIGDDEDIDGTADNFVIFRITLTSTDPDLATLQYEQFAPVAHSSPTLFDEEAPLYVIGDENVKLRWTTEADDADGDEDSHYAEVDLITNQTTGQTVLSFDDDGPAPAPTDPFEIEEDDLRAAIGSGSNGIDEDNSVVDDAPGNHTVTTNFGTLIDTLGVPGIESPLTFSMGTNTSGLPSLKSKGENISYEVIPDDATNPTSYTLHAYVEDGTDDTGFDVNDREVFRWTLTTAGVATFLDIDQIDHTSGGGENQLTINLTSLLTVLDADGDKIDFATLDPDFLLYRVQDDIPLIAKKLEVVEDVLTIVDDDIEGGKVELQAGAKGDSLTKSLKGIIGTDENPTSDYKASDGTLQYTFNSASVIQAGLLTGLTVDFSADMATAYFFVDGATGTAGEYDAGIDTLWFTNVLNQSAGTYTFTVEKEAPEVFTLYGFNDLPAGDNLFGFVGDTDNAILVFGSDPDLDGDNEKTPSSQTVNSSKGSKFADTVIGNSNNHFDNDGEDLWVVFVNNPDPRYLAGYDDGTILGLDQNEADDADFAIQAAGATEDFIDPVTSAFLQTSRVVGGKDAALQLTSWDLPDAYSDTDGAALISYLDTNGLDPNPAGATALSYTKVVVYAPIDLRLEGTTLGDDGVVLLELEYDPAGVSDPDAVYSLIDADVYIDFGADGESVEIGGLQDGMVVEWFTDGEADATNIDYVQGQYDIGFIGSTESNAVPDVKVDFSVNIQDYDNDKATSNTFEIYADGTGPLYDNDVFDLI